MARKLETITKDINTNNPELTATISNGYSGNKVGNKIVIAKSGDVIFEHNSAMTYSKNSDVEFWLTQYRERRTA